MRSTGTRDPNSNPGTPFPISSILHSPSPSTASTPRLVEETGFEGNSPAPWNDAVQDALLLVGRHNPILQSHSQAESEPPIVSLQKQQDLLRNEIAVLEQLHGKTHPLTLEKTDRLLWLLIDCDKYKAAEKLGRHTFLALRQSRNIKAACNTLIALADMYSYQGDNEKAEKAAKKALDMTTTSGQGTVLEAKFKLAEKQYNLGKWDEAEDLVSQLLDVDNKRPIPQFYSPPEGPTGLMAAICLRRGRLKEARDWSAQTLRIIDVKGSEYSSAWRLKCVEVLLEQWKLGEASAIITQRLANSLRNFGQESMNTESWLWNHGNLSTLQGAWEEAESCLLASISTSKKIIGPRSRVLHSSLWMLFRVYVEQLAWDKASVVVREYREIPSGSRLPVMEAEVLDAQGRHKEAYDRACEAMQHYEIQYPLEGPRNNSVMVRILRNLGRLEESQELGARTLTMAEKMFGNSHPQTIRCKDNLARTYMAGGDAVAAIQAITECVQLFTAHESVGPDHYLTRRSRDTLTEWLVFADPASVSPFQVQDLSLRNVEMLY